MAELLETDAAVRERVVAVWSQVIDYNDPVIAQPLPISLEPARLTRFPYLRARCFWPFAGTDPRNVGEPHYPDGRFPFSDRFAAALAGTKGSDEALYAAYVGLTRDALADPAAFLVDTLAEIAARDRMCSVRVSVPFMQRLGQEKWFHTSQSPAGAAYRWLADALLVWLCYPILAQLC